jgi:hypothetical protein
MILICQIWTLLHMICMRTIREHIPKYQTFDDVSPDTHDCHVGAEVELSIGDKVMSRKVKR